MSEPMRSFDDIHCDACSVLCDGAWECNACGATLCFGCGAEYGDVCSLCIDDTEPTDE